MAKPNKILRHNILIVCEGENTEPQYFASLIPLAKKAWGDNPKLFVEISPKPKLVDESVPNERVSKHKTARKKRQLKTVPTEPSLIENEFKAVPVRYVREAQQGLEDGTYEEAWAVFDKDYHPKHKEAFELAKEEVDGEKVQIAFSSISFEQWILLHFEKSFTPFGKSAALIERLQKVKPELQDYSKSVTATDFTFLHPHYLTAFENAAWLRFQYQKNKSDLPIYERNPYTNMDELVRHLLQIQRQILWVALEEVYTFTGMTIQFSKISATFIELRLTNNGMISYILSPKELYTISNEIRSPLTDEKSIISTKETIIIPIANTSPINFLLNVGEGYRFIVNS